MMNALATLWPAPSLGLPARHPRPQRVNQHSPLDFGLSGGPGIFLIAVISPIFHFTLHPFQLHQTNLTNQQGDFIWEPATLILALAI